MQPSEQILSNNRAWVQEKLASDPGYFDSLSVSQNPDFLWIGCSDSRVTPNEITSTALGEMFVHRNIANLVVPGDLNLLSVVQYAVEMLHVRHVVVCGHYECGGVKAAMEDKKLGLIDQWLDHIRQVEAKHRLELDRISEFQARYDRLVELNIQEQVLHVAATDSVRQMWAENQMPILHGWVFNLRTGLLNEVLRLEPPVGEPGLNAK